MYCTFFILFFLFLTKYIVFPKIPKLDEQSKKQAIDMRATESKYMEETINRSTSKKRHTRGKQIVENKMVPILNPPLVSCVAASPQIFTAVEDVVDEQTSNSFSSGTLEFIETHSWSALLVQKYFLKYEDHYLQLEFTFLC